MVNETFLESAVTLRFGFVTELDGRLGRVRCRLPDLDDLVTWWLPVLHPKTHRDRHWHLPDVGEHVALLLDTRGETGVVLGALYSERDLPPADTPDKHHARFADGTWVEYDRAAHSLTVSCRGQVTIIADGPVSVTAPSVTLDSPQVTVTGHLSVGKGIAVTGSGGAAASITGDVSVDGSISASGSIMDAGGNSNHHSH